ncbi:MAG: hypothetical protein JO077_07610 [Verrucomicrobia bacterium]|nr:hypothetical protein [Verrucomicrobiota bacterium]
MEYWSFGVLEQALGGEPLLIVRNQSHDRADRRGAAAGLFGRRLPGTPQSVVLPYTSLFSGLIERRREVVYVEPFAGAA